MRALIEHVRNEPKPNVVSVTTNASLFAAKKSLEYTQLPSSGSFVRLLDLLPGNHDDMLECNLRVASLRSQLSYKALSYAWIDETVSASKQDSETIMCNEQQIVIPTNLHSALKTFRSNTSILTLWVDILCINQKSTLERSQQVGMMRAIYSNSAEVLIWLGPNVYRDLLGNDRTAYLGMEDDSKIIWYNDSRDVLMVQSYLEQFSAYEFGGANSSLTAASSGRDVFGAFVLLHRLAQGEMLKYLRFYQASITSREQIFWSFRVRKGIEAIVDSSWWQRTWVIQETILPRKATVHLGHISAPWTMLAEGAAAYSQQLPSRRPDDRDPLSSLSKVILDLETVRIARIDEIRLPLLHMLRRFRNKKSSDPRDKVFALLGLAREQMQSCIKPDYNLSNEEVMLRTSIAMIHEAGGLEPLAGRVSGPESYPSWVTDWSKLPVGNERERLDCLSLYNASGGQPGSAELHGQSLLKLQGRAIGEIVYVGAEAPDGGFGRMRGFVHRWASEWDQLPAASSPSIYADSTDAFRRTIIADTLYARSSVRSSWAHEDAKYSRATSDVSRAYGFWQEDDTIQRNRKTSFGPAGLVKNYVEFEGVTALKNSFYYAVQTASGSRRFFATSTGFIGVGPANLQEGDVAYIVLGSRVPFIMRRRSQFRRCSQETVNCLFDYSGGARTNMEVCNQMHGVIHALVGDAYVHGVMDGTFTPSVGELRSLYVL